MCVCVCVCIYIANCGVHVDRKIFCSKFWERPVFAVSAKLKHKEGY